MTLIRISQPIIDSFPDLRIGVVWGSIYDPIEDINSEIEHIKSDELSYLQSLGLRTEKLTDHVNIQSWRTAYQKFGVKAKRHKPTHEALIRRLLKDEGWPNINQLVDIYLSNQARHILPHGGYDLDNVRGNIVLRFSDGNENFIALGGEEELTEPGEVIYADEARVLTRRWNYKDSEQTKITAETKNFSLFVESPGFGIAASEIDNAVNDLSSRIRRLYKSEISTGYLDRYANELSI